MRGPIGGYFVWRPDDPDPVLLVAGGSGIVPLMSMVRARGAADQDRTVWADRRLKMTTTQTYVDGDELGGTLREIFAVEVTTARTECAGCGRTGTIAETRVYDRAPGLVARCPGCEAVILRLVRAPGRLWLDLRGATYLGIDMPDQVTA